MFSQNCRDVQNEVFEEKIAFFVFVFFVLLQEKQKNGERPKNPIKKVFLRWSSKDEKNDKNVAFFLAKIA